MKDQFEIYMFLYALTVPLTYYYLPERLGEITVIIFLIIMTLKYGSKGGILGLIWSFGIGTIVQLTVERVALNPLKLQAGIIHAFFMVMGISITKSILDKEREKRVESEMQLKDITDHMQDIIIKIGLDGKVQYISPSCKKILGIEAKHLMGKSAFEGLDPQDKTRIIQVFNKAIENKGYIMEEYRYEKSKGEFIWLEATGNIMEDDDGKVTGIVVSVRDVTERRKYQQKIEYLSYHDKLTGTYNRAYFEEKLMELDEKEAYPLSIIIGDVNGLKLINDVFGHEEGDKTLIKIAQAIEANCRKGDVYSRWGGDEFAMILPETDEITASILAGSIEVACKKIEGLSIQVSLSVGSATKKHQDENIYTIVNIAEKNMYQHKLLESKSARNSIISSLQNTLFERSNETEEHARRMQVLGIHLGKALGLQASDIDHIRLSALLHDIGKIAISDTVLNKPGALTKEEWEEIKKHPEIGYRIAQASPELAHIAEDILYHHERWDGTGYPQGLKGTNIPIRARVLAVIDAYDVMVNARVYKNPLTHEAAIEEIKNCGGTQFDPHISAVFTDIMAKGEMVKNVAIS